MIANELTHNQILAIWLLILVEAGPDSVQHSEKSPCPARKEQVQGIVLINNEHWIDID